MVGSAIVAHGTHSQVIVPTTLHIKRNLFLKRIRAIPVNGHDDVNRRRTVLAMHVIDPFQNLQAVIIHRDDTGILFDSRRTVKIMVQVFQVDQDFAFDKAGIVIKKGLVVIKRIQFIRVASV